MSRPLRVVVVGSSVTFQVAPDPVTVDDAPYPGLLDGALRDRGVEAVTQLRARWHATAKEVLARHEPWVRDALPHVVVLNVGFPDCQPRTVPTWLYRHVITWQPGLSGASVRYRARVVPLLRRVVRRWQQLVAGRLPLRLSRLSPAAFRRAVTRTVRHSVRDHRALVLVLDIDPPGPAVQRLMPGLDARVAAYNAVLADVVRAAGDERVVLVRTSELVAADPEALLPDGIHRSAAAHRLVAERLADVITENGALVGLGPA